MILNVSGRTDVVAFYMDWFMKRLESGFVYVRNPFYYDLVHKIEFKDVDMIVFCTKDPRNILKYLDDIKIPFVVHVTLTPYGKDIEPNVPDKNVTIETIKKISKRIGKDHIFWRYDPILLNEKYDTDYHLNSFEGMCEKLDGFIESVIVSFIDYYKNVEHNMDALNLKDITSIDLEKIGLGFSNIANKHVMTVQTCAEEETLFQYGFIQRDCITSDLVEKIAEVSIEEKWKARKGKCNCVKMYDIGAYNTCSHLCKYCYANFDEKTVGINRSRHNADSPLIIGDVKEGDIIKDINR